MQLTSFKKHLIESGVTPTLALIKSFIFLKLHDYMTRASLLWTANNPEIDNSSMTCIIDHFMRVSCYSGTRSDGAWEWIALSRGNDYAYQRKIDKSARMKGSNNPGWNHGGKLSPFSKKFVKGDMTAKTMEKSKATRRAHPERQSTHIEYWLDRADGDMEKAQEMLKERQAVGRLDKFIERYGEEEGQRRWEERQQKWLKSFKKQNFSKVSQELFWSVLRLLPREMVRQCRFAQFDGFHEYFDGSNMEKILRIGGRTIKPDFIFQNKIIEFDGDYWHKINSRGNKRRDTERDETLKAAGYLVLHIKERDYRTDHIACIESCIDFLNQP